MNKKELIKNCSLLIEAYKTGKLGQTVMPEDTNPGFTNRETEVRFTYFTLPMSLNYQRNSYELWKSALDTYRNPETRGVFDVNKSSRMTKESLRNKLMKYKLALQPNKHIDNWHKISQTISDNWGSITKIVEAINLDFIKLKQLIQVEYKQGFPYLSGPKIFNYWSFILTQYCNVKLTNAEYIDIAPDTHITKCSVILGVITKKESESLSKDEISKRWKELLKNTNINPIDMHPPLWFWSRNGFIYDLNELVSKTQDSLF